MILKNLLFEAIYSKDESLLKEAILRIRGGTEYNTSLEANFSMQDFFHRAYKRSPVLAVITSFQSTKFFKLEEKYVAAKEEVTRQVKLLLDAGADFNTPDTSNWTPLLAAVERGLVDVVRLLLEAGANSEHTLPNGFTALHVAAKSREVVGVTTSVSRKANIDLASCAAILPINPFLKDNHNRKALEYARESSEVFNSIYRRETHWLRYNKIDAESNIQEEVLPPELSVEINAETGHVAAVKFAKSNDSAIGKRGAPALVGAKKWILPEKNNLVILTGRTGSGKTQLLNRIAGYLSHKQNNVLLVEGYRSFFNGTIEKDSSKRRLYASEPMSLLYHKCLKYSRNMQGDNPLVIINNILAEYNFKYRATFMPFPGGRDGKIFFKRSELIDEIDEVEGMKYFMNDEIPTDVVRPMALSTGEIAIFGILSLLENAKSEGRDIRVLLLDEPDRNFDPQTCMTFFQVLRKLTNANEGREGIQVIMTTHRVDTLSMAPRGSIFSINVFGYNQLAIQQMTTLEGMYRLTPNLRQFTNIRTRVYTESHDDAIFMDGIYQVVMKFSNIARLHNGSAVGTAREKVSMEWPVVTDRLMSRRHPMTFVSSAFRDKGSGGRNVVEELTNRDLSHRLLLQEMYERDEKISLSSHERKMHNDILQITKPLGLLDRDYGDFKIKAMAIPPGETEEYAERFIKLRRHSIENYIFDPFIVATVGEIERYKEPLKTICLNLRDAIEEKNVERIQSAVTDYCIEILEAASYPEIEKIHSDIDKKFWNFGGSGIDEARAITKKYAEVIRSKVEECVRIGVPYDRDRHFDLLCALEQKRYNRDLAVFTDTGIRPRLPIIDADHRKQFEVLCQIVKPERWSQHLMLQSERVRTRPARIMLDHNIVIEVDYPELFLNVRGHDIEDAFKRGMPNKEKAARHLLERAATATALPMDLVEVFLDLNRVIIAQTRKVTKPNHRIETTLGGGSTDSRASDKYTSSSGRDGRNNMWPGAEESKGVEGGEEARLVHQLRDRGNGNVSPDSLPFAIKLINEGEEQIYDLDVYGDGNCLLYAFTLSYLAPYVESEVGFNQRYEKLFSGEASVLRTAMQNYQPNANWYTENLYDLVNKGDDCLRKKLVHKLRGIETGNPELLSSVIRLYEGRDTTEEVIELLGSKDSFGNQAEAILLALLTESYVEFNRVGGVDYMCPDGRVSQTLPEGIVLSASILSTTQVKDGAEVGHYHAFLRANRLPEGINTIFSDLVVRDIDAVVAEGEIKVEVADYAASQRSVSSGEGGEANVDPAFPLPQLNAREGDSEAGQVPTGRIRRQVGDSCSADGFGI